MFYGEWKAATLLEADCDVLAIEGINSTKTDGQEVDKVSRNLTVDEVFGNI